jgi:hypothetical protein
VLFNVLTQSRDGLRRSRLEWIGFAARSIVEEQVRSRTAVVRALSEYGLSAAWISGRHRQIYRRLARRKVAVFRVSAVLFFLIIGSLIAFWFTLGSYFGRHGLLGTVLPGGLGYFVVSLPPVLTMLLFRLSSVVMAALGVYLGALFIGSGLIVYGEVKMVGPVHAVVGDLEGSNSLIYMLAQGVLTYGYLLVVVVLFTPIAIFVYRRFIENPVDSALRIMFQSIAMARSEEQFLRLGTRHNLVALLYQLSLIIRRGLWRALRPRNVLARSELKRRCTLAGYAMDMLGVWVTLPARTTHADFLTKICALTDTLLSGRWDELPTEPQRSAISHRRRLAFIVDLGRTVLIGIAPLATLQALQLFKISPPGEMNVALQGIFWAWFAAALLKALSELSIGRIQLRELRALIAQFIGGK